MFPSSDPAQKKESGFPQTPICLSWKEVWASVLTLPNDTQIHLIFTRPFSTTDSVLCLRMTLESQTL